MKEQKSALRGALAALLIGAAAWLPLGAHADTKVRVSSFEYDAATGLLVKEWVEPDSPNDCVQTTHTYDAYGNKASISNQLCTGATGTVTWSATAVRSASTNYGTDGRFPVTST